jgi:hypothetical protein
MHYMHQTQLSELNALPPTDGSPLQFWTGNIEHSIAPLNPVSWSVLESSGALVGEFVAEDDGFAVIEDDGDDHERFDNWRSAVRSIVRRGQKAA